MSRFLKIFVAFSFVCASLPVAAIGHAVVHSLHLVHAHFHGDQTHSHAHDDDQHHEIHSVSIPDLLSQQSAALRHCEVAALFVVPRDVANGEAIKTPDQRILRRGADPPPRLHTVTARHSHTNKAPPA